MLTYDNAFRPHRSRHCSPSPGRTAIASVCNDRCCIGTDLGCKSFLLESKKRNDQRAGSTNLNEVSVIGFLSRANPIKRLSSRCVNFS